MATQVNPPRGMRDFLPEEKARRERVLAVIRDTYRAHGFDEIETPVVEDSSRLHAGLGGDNEKLAFGILKRGLTAEDLAAASDPLDLADLGLRFDLTVPLTRFYATHRAALPSVFRAIQLGSVWRAERPQKGRYRQFVQCDIDIIGDATGLAEAELLVASLATFDALGLDGVVMRVNDRRILTGLLDHLGFPAESHAGVLVTLDKLDRVGPDGVVAELEANGAAPDAVAAVRAYLTRPQTREFIPYGERQIRTALPDGFDSPAVADLVALGENVAGALAAGPGGAASARDLPLLFDPFLVRGMGYYTGAIFEAMHPSAGYSLGGGGRYDGMIGRFLGTEVPATGFSIGFERIVDLVTLRDDEASDAVVLLYDSDADSARLVALKAELIAQGRRVRLERAPRNVKGLLDSLAAFGFRQFAHVGDAAAATDLTFKPLG
ncbi:histidyl-tRNA synthetase [Cryobacterium mesophilum]|uniref:Histidyl-tRNA synthetase n=1 Tax=Terrimesophilobacter mesophilus TaxID=433647 RepID=A0A4R8VCK0_9MICO|nr:ATP phosphoribosyltransferase regulatory subunit [Terrimesophilobacter mesophilus]MBB5633753.1 histidyl-tRNA synthetase [Terrimesophilobacter mesophilus]TFB80435.1 histidine--tRNA ligase [Terrimesophilobacter mesophilus]